MTGIAKVKGRAYPLPLRNVDTDLIIPAAHLKTINRNGLGRQAFETLRVDPANVFDNPRFAGAPILVALDNFGCGSSREHAPWALADFGITCVIAPSFGDIFFNNSMKNGMLPIRLPREVCEELMQDAAMGGNARLTVDLERQVVVRPSGEEIHFEIDPLRKHYLLNGLDDIGQTLQHGAQIDGFEARRRQAQPWLPSTTAA